MRCLVVACLGAAASFGMALGASEGFSADGPAAAIDLAAGRQALLLATAMQSPLPNATPAAPQQAFLDRYCTDCHNDGEKTANLTLERVNDARMGSQADVWEKVVRKVRSGMMPPAGHPRPNAAELQRFAGSVEAQLDRYAAAHPDPGGGSLHRLNRNEYANAVRDLLAVEVNVSTLLPPDDSSEGFDNIAEALGVSPALIQGYVSAAMKISRQAVGDLTLLPTTRVSYRAPAGLAQDRHIDGLPVGTRGGMIATHAFPLDAEYEFSIAGGGGGGGRGALGGGPPAGPSTEVIVTLDGQPLEVRNTGRFSMRLPAGPHTIAAAVIDRARPAGVDEIYGRYAAGGGVSAITIVGPRNPTGPGDTPARRRILICTPDAPAKEDACARKILARLATRAFRRPVAETDPEMKPLMAAYGEGRKQGDFEIGVQHGLARVLVDPRFLFRIESEPANVRPGSVYRISDLELASRLSFFLWSSIPDDELLDTAAKGQLSRPATLERQVKRMLADPKAAALVENFAGQWLLLRELAEARPDSRDFNGNLREAFRQETEMLFGSILKEDRSIVTLLDADYTFVDERLARHYGIEGVRGSYMRRVSLPKDHPRRGILGQGSVLTVTSAADRTSPVSRGKWVVENLLGAPVPLPPPGVETNLDQTANIAGPTTLRARLERHRTDPTCASCHQIMDPIGFAMEPFDRVGKWRDEDGGLPIDSTGKLMDGTLLSGPADLRHALLQRSDAFVTTFSERLMTYAVGRNLRPADMPAVRAVVRDGAKQDHRFSALVMAIVRSAPFQQKLKAPAPPGPRTTVASNAPNGKSP